MRARNVKPSLFKNELLATSDPLHAWVFEGLWCLADREGRLEDRPRRIHLEINPGRAYEGTEAALAWLAQHGFIVRYSHGSGQYIQVANFTKHQNPHVREPASAIAPPGSSIGQVPDIATHIYTPQPDSSTVPAPGQNGTGPALSPSPLPDSPSLIPRDTHTPRARERSPADEAEHHVMFQRVQKDYPKFAGRQNWITAENWCRARIDQGATWNQLHDAVKRYAAYVEAGGVSSTQYVLTPEKFFGAGDDPWKQAWEPPEAKPKAKVVGWRPPPDDEQEAAHA